MFFIRHRRIWYTLSALFLGLSLYAMLAYGFNLSIDFRGGTLTEVQYQGERPSKENIERWVGQNDFGGFSVRPAGDTGYIIRTRELTGNEMESLRASLALSSVMGTIERQTTIGPTAGAELAGKALTAVAVAVVMIVLFVTIAFRKVSKPVSSWKYGIATIASLFHDVLIPTGVFVFLGHLYGIEIDLLFVTGVLAILGFSVHDTIVVFDRVRENLRINQERNLHEKFDEVVGRSVMQTLARSINTSLTLLVVLAALYLFGSNATKDFSLLMIVGTFVGAYSSVFIASPLLVTFAKLGQK